MSITSEIAALIATNNILESKMRDKYGRSMSRFDLFDRETRVRSIVVLVALPKTSDHRYLVNNWEKKHYEETSVWYFENRNAAKKFALDELIETHQKRVAAKKAEIAAAAEKF